MNILELLVNKAVKSLRDSSPHLFVVAEAKEEDIHDYEKLG